MITVGPSIARLSKPLKPTVRYTNFSSMNSCPRLNLNFKPNSPAMRQINGTDVDLGLQISLSTKGIKAEPDRRYNVPKWQIAGLKVTPSEGAGIIDHRRYR